MLDDAPRPRTLIGLSIPLVAALLWSRPGAPPAPAPAPVRTGTFAPQLNVQVVTTAASVPAAPAPANRPSCPPPRRDAPWVSPVLPESIDSVQPAPTNAGWIAAWNADHVFVSYDAGTTFRRVLDGKGRVVDASFDCFGRLVVLRDDQVGVRDGSDERWHAVPRLRTADDDQSTDPRRVLGGGPDVVVLGAAPDEIPVARVAISSDAAATWHYVDVDATLENGHGEQHADGTIDAVVITGDCMDDDLTWATIRGEDVTTTAASLGEGAPNEIYGNLLVVGNAWKTRDGAWNELAIPGTASQLVPLPGPFPVLEGDDKAYRLVDGKLRELPVTLDGAALAVDLAGRIWTSACGRLLVARRTSAHVADACLEGD